MARLSSQVTNKAPVPLTMEMTVDQFVAKEISVWGEDEIFRLMDAGYTPIETDDGTFKWLAPDNVTVVPNG